MAFHGTLYFDSNNAWPPCFWTTFHPGGTLVRFSHHDWIIQAIPFRVSHMLHSKNDLPTPEIESFNYLLCVATFSTPSHIKPEVKFKFQSWYTFSGSWSKSHRVQRSKSSKVGITVITSHLCVTAHLQAQTVAAVSCWCLKTVHPINEGVWPGDEAFPQSSLAWLSLNPIRIVTSCPKPKGTVKNVSDGFGWHPQLQIVKVLHSGTHHRSH